MVGFGSNIRISLRGGLFNAVASNSNGLSLLRELIDETGVDSLRVRPRTRPHRSAAVHNVLIETMKGRDSVVFLENGCLGSDLRRVELDLFWVLLGLDFDEAVNWLLHRFAEVP